MIQYITFNTFGIRNPMYPIIGISAYFDSVRDLKRDQNLSNVKIKKLLKYLSISEQARELLECIAPATCKETQCLTSMV